MTIVKEVMMARLRPYFWDKVNVDTIERTLIFKIKSSVCEDVYNRVLDEIRNNIWNDSYERR